MRLVIIGFCLLFFCAGLYMIFAQEDDTSSVPDWVISRYDPSTGITWYKPQPEYSEYTNTFALHIGKKHSGKPWLVLRIAHTYGWERDILLIYKFSIRTSNKSFVIRTSFNSVNRSINHIQRNFSEWYDNYVYPELYNIIKQVINSETVVIGFHGINGYAERRLEKMEKQRLQSMLDLYEELGGDFQFK
jgi:hypothetical protein